MKRATQMNPIAAYPRQTELHRGFDRHRSHPARLDRLQPPPSALATAEHTWPPASEVVIGDARAQMMNVVEPDIA